MTTKKPTTGTPKKPPQKTGAKTVKTAKPAAAKASRATSLSRAKTAPAPAAAKPAKPAAKKPAAKKPAAQPSPAERAAAEKAAAKGKPAAARKPRKTATAAAPAAPSLGDRIKAWIDADKGEEIVTIDLAGKSAMADAMVIASGRSSRHVAAMAEHVIENLKKSGAKVARAEGMARGDWVLIDAGDVIVHLFRPEVRKFYALEKLWNLDETGPEQVAVKP